MKIILPSQVMAATMIAAMLAFAPLAMAQTVLPPPSSNPQVDAYLSRIEELQAQLQAATAENEGLQRQVYQQQQEVSRLQMMVGELSAANANAVQQSQTPPAPPPAQGRATGQLSAAQQAATGTLGSMPVSATPSPSDVPGDPASDFARARQLLDEGNLAEAELAFSDFLRLHERASNVGEARYWYAYTLLARNNYPDAAAGFVDFLRRYPNGRHAADAQVNLGMALAGANNRQQACAAFIDVPRRYPRAAQATRDRAAREARAHNCSA